MFAVIDWIWSIIFFKCWFFLFNCFVKSIYEFLYCFSATLISFSRSLPNKEYSSLLIAAALQLNSSDNCVHYYNVEILNLFDPELQLVNIKPMIKNKFKGLLSELKKLKIQTVFVLDYKKRNCHKMFHSGAKLMVIRALMKRLNH